MKTYIQRMLILAAVLVAPSIASADDSQLVLCTEDACSAPIPLCSGEFNFDKIVADLAPDDAKKVPWCGMWAGLPPCEPVLVNCCGEGPHCEAPPPPPPPDCCVPDGEECLVAPDDFWFEAMIDGCEPVDERDGMVLFSCP